MKKNAKVYILILCVWGVCAALLMAACGKMVYDLFTGQGFTWATWLAAALLLVNGAMLAYMWLGSVKDFLFSLIFL